MRVFDIPQVIQASVFNEEHGQRRVPPTHAHSPNCESKSQRKKSATLIRQSLSKLRLSTVR